MDSSDSGGLHTCNALAHIALSIGILLAIHEFHCHWQIQLHSQWYSQNLMFDVSSSLMPLTKTVALAYIFFKTYIFLQLFIRYRTNKPLLRQSWVKRMTKGKEKIMTMVAKWLDTIPDKRPSNYEQLFKMPCYAVSLLQAQSTLMLD